MFLVLGIPVAGLIFYVFLLILGAVVYLYIFVKRLFSPTRSDYLSDDVEAFWDYDSDGDD